MSADLPQSRSLMHGDVVRFVAFDFILRILWAGVMCVAFIINGFGVDLDNPAADPTGFGIPSDVIADFELFSHLIPIWR